MVIGDQSSGKSSLLEAITGLSFPIASELCTRFATQIVLRRSPEAESLVTVSILPGPTARDDEERKAKLQAFGRTLETVSLDADEFAKILDEVCTSSCASIAVSNGIGV